MLVASLCQQLCPDKLPVELGQKLGDGADGEVLAIAGDLTRVIKLGILYEHPAAKLEKTYSGICKTLDFMLRTQPCAYVRVYQHGPLGVFSRKNIAYLQGEQRFSIYYYLMERLHKISEDERKVFHTILSHEDRGISKDWSLEKIREMLDGMERGLDFEVGRVMLFCQHLRQSPIAHNDVHPRNIMRDSNGDYKLIDLDRSKIGE